MSFAILCLAGVGLFYAIRFVGFCFYTALSLLLALDRSGRS